ncbi:alpha-amylase family glycosyl hydrolase [Actinomyces radicidentis]|uniref:alpha-amylase family glycosyl hydrolase n=1 Tax=Actinomyces radicidentis TaxID=111015 RepID=UPI003F658AA1
MTGRHGMTDLAHQAAADMRATMAQVEERTGRETWLVAEHFHDASADLTGPGWHGAMNYMGLTRPLWAWLSATQGEAAHLFDSWPTPVPHLPGDEVVAGARRYAGTIPPAALERSMNLLGSHDTPRVRSVVGTRELQMVAATVLFTVPGVPAVFSGDELGATGTTGEHSRTTIPWVTGTDGVQGPEVAEYGSWGGVDRVVLGHYRALAARRRATPSLRRGGLRWLHAGADLLVWQRTHPDGDVLVAVARDAAAPVRVPLAALPAGAVGRIGTVGALSATVEGERPDAVLVLAADGPGSVIVDLTRAASPTH